MASSPVFVPRSSSQFLQRLVLAASLLVVVVPAVTPMYAQEVTLRIRPTLGDTLRMKMDQKFEVLDDETESTGTSAANSTSPMSATVSVGTRSIVRATSAQSAELESVTDSVTIVPAIASALPLFAQTRAALERQKVRLRVTPDGAITIINGSKNGTKSASSKGTLTTQSPLQMSMPALLPKEPVSVGETWTRSLPIPLSATNSAQGLVRVTFRLDSLRQNSNLAYISMKGTFSHAQSAMGAATVQDSLQGTVTGGMLIDRKRGWMTDSKAIISLVSTTRPQKGAAPIRMRLKVTQWLRLVTSSGSAP